MGAAGNLSQSQARLGQAPLSLPVVQFWEQVSSRQQRCLASAEPLALLWPAPRGTKRLTPGEPLSPGHTEEGKQWASLPGLSLTLSQPTARGKVRFVQWASGRVSGSRESCSLWSISEKV